MKRSVLAILLLAIGFSATANAQPKKKKPCRSSLATCPDEGCGTQFDGNLNKKKNLITVTQSATLKRLTWMKKLDDPETFSQGDTREELTELGEGQEITVVAYLLVAKAELGGESCNCGLQTAAETDNHLVLVRKLPWTSFQFRWLATQPQERKYSSHVSRNQ